MPASTVNNDPERINFLHLLFWSPKQQSQEINLSFFIAGGC